MTKLDRFKVWIHTTTARVSAAQVRSAARGIGFVTGVVLLALVGSGRFARWLTPSADLGIHVAEAAPLPASASSAEPNATISARPTGSVALAPPALAADTASNERPIEGGDVGDAGAASAGVAPDGKVILNLANEEDLRRLPGIGHGRAQAILTLRGQLKKFTRVEDLLKVKGIGRRGLARIRPLVRVD